MWPIRTYGAPHNDEEQIYRLCAPRLQGEVAQNAGDPTQVMSITEKINPNALHHRFRPPLRYIYKRAHLLFSNLDRLAAIVNNPDRPVQFVFSGKAHPADGAGQGLIKRIVEISRMPQFLGKIIFLENYDMIVAKRLVSGVDIWLNTPTRPLEASGTSGEKAEMNGVLNFSVLDGMVVRGLQILRRGRMGAHRQAYIYRPGPAGQARCRGYLHHA